MINASKALRAAIDAVFTAGAVSEGQGLAGGFRQLRRPDSGDLHTGSAPHLRVDTPPPSAFRCGARSGLLIPGPGDEGRVHAAGVAGTSRAVAMCIKAVCIYAYTGKLLLACSGDML